jgi:membrane-bound serine protease (ClpP class)
MGNRKLHHVFLIFAGLVLLSLPLCVLADKVTQIDVGNILYLEIDSSINPATFSYLNSGLAKAKLEGAQAILVRLNTPGGLVSTTKKILTLIGDSDIPFIVWVAPEGASATSAGAIISSAAHVLFMSEGTNIGAATPIGLGGDLPGGESKNTKNIVAPPTGGDLRKKAINDLVALVQSLSEARKRNSVLFGAMVSEGKSFKAQEAFEKNLIDGIANSKADVLKNLNNRSLEIKGRTHIFNVLPEAVFTPFEMDMGQKTLNIFADPSMAYVLLLMGAALIYLEFHAPGGFIAGPLGAVCLILAGISFQLLPLNFGALALILLGLVLFVLEIYITSYALLTLGGIVSLVFGSLFLFRSPSGEIALGLPIIFSAVGAFVLFIVFVGLFMFFDRRRKKHLPSYNSLLGKTGKVCLLGDDDFHCQVRVAGEIWNAVSDKKLSLHSFIKVTAEDKERMILTVVNT